MRVTHLMIGVSFLTLAAGGTASAQPTNITDVQCSPFQGNDCVVDNDDIRNDRNQATVRVNGRANNVLVRQVEDDIRSLVQIEGDENFVTHNQVGDAHSASATIVGNNNLNVVIQGDEENSASVTQQGNRNESNVLQGAVGALSGENNRATVVMRGSDLFSSVVQGSIGGGGPVATVAGPMAAGSDNIAQITLTNAAGGDGQLVQLSSVLQLSRGNTAIVNIVGGSALNNAANASNITQSNTQFRNNAAGNDFDVAPPTAANNPMTHNLADVSISGNGNNSFIQQNGVRNLARVSISRGGTGITATGGGTFDGLAFQGDREEGNTSLVSQFGRDLSVDISVGGRRDGQGGGNSLFVVQGGSCGCIELGRGHSATLYQFGTLSDLVVVQQNNQSSSAISATNPSGDQFGSVADISQSAFGSSIQLFQSGTNYAFISQGSASADVGNPAAGLGPGNAGTSGNNTLIVQQIDAGDRVTFSGGGGGPFAPPPSSSTEPRRNTFLASQAGRSNVGIVTQFATNASATLFQRRGSVASQVRIAQGLATADGFASAGGEGPASPSAAGVSVNLTASVDQGGSGFVDVRQDGGNLDATVRQNAVNFSTAVLGATPVVRLSQVGEWNSATVDQSGVNSLATVDQRNVGTSAFRSQITITQTGGGPGLNLAVARQTNASGGVSDPASLATGPAGDPDSRLAGARANLIEITQSNDSTVSAGGDNSATVEQRGSGQYGRIVQNGHNNEAGILQELGATSAVAIVEQLGSDNRFFITQDQANQFMRVRQTGAGNLIVTTVFGPASAPPGGVGGFGDGGPVATPPPFTPG